MSKEVDEMKVQVAAAWTCFDTLASEVEALKGQTVIHIGRALEKARAMKAQLQKTQALPSPTRNAEQAICKDQGCPYGRPHYHDQSGPVFYSAKEIEAYLAQDERKETK